MASYYVPDVAATKSCNKNCSAHLVSCAHLVNTLNADVMDTQTASLAVVNITGISFFEGHLDQW